jgi:hypothetical protein
MRARLTGLVGQGHVHGHGADSLNTRACATSCDTPSCAATFAHATPTRRPPGGDAMRSRSSAQDAAPGRVAAATKNRARSSFVIVRWPRSQALAKRSSRMCTWNKCTARNAGSSGASAGPVWRTRMRRLISSSLKRSISRSAPGNSRARARSARVGGVVVDSLRRRDSSVYLRSSASRACGTAEAEPSSPSSLEKATTITSVAQGTAFGMLVRT